MKFNLRNPFFLFGLVLLWRVALLVFTAQPIPASDAFFYDGAVVNWLRHGHYFIPAAADLFPISGSQVFSAYPPGYQAAVLVWMTVFGTSVISSMALHLALFAASGFLALAMVKKFFPPAANYAVVALLFLGMTFGDRPEDLAHVFGLGSLLLVVRHIAGNGGWKPAAAVALLLVVALFTSPVSAAYYFGIGFTTAAAAWLAHRRNIVFAPFIAAAAMFAAITFAITRLEPLWWQGFMETARQQSVVTTGFHLPHGLEIIKLVRNAPVFLLALAFVPVALARRKQLAGEPWLLLTAGIFVVGWALLVASVTLLAPNYVGYALFSQIILAAGLLALGEKLFPGKFRWLTVLILGCAALVSVRAVGMTTWGAACAWKNSHGRTQATLRAELAPFARTNLPVLVSSAYLYSAAELGVQRPVYADWYFDHAAWTNDAEVNALIRLKPAKLVLTQFDYYRSFVPVLERLRQLPGLVELTVRDQAAVRTPDSIPSLQRVVQHISWAPVIVDLDWKPATPEARGR